MRNCVRFVSALLQFTHNSVNFKTGYIVSENDASYSTNSTKAVVTNSDCMRCHVHRCYVEDSEAVGFGRIREGFAQM